VSGLLANVLPASVLRGESDQDDPVPNNCESGNRASNYRASNTGERYRHARPEPLVRTAVLLTGAVAPLDFFIVNGALPSIATDLGARPANLHVRLRGGVRNVADHRREAAEAAQAPRTLSPRGTGQGSVSVVTFASRPPLSAFFTQY
jgi:hypothetical protein